MKDLVIVESPSKAKTIEKYLGKDYKVLSSKGHIRDLAIKGKGGLGVDVENDFEPTYVVSNDKKDVVKQLQSEAAKAGKVYLATDMDREGEAISWHLAEVLGLDVKDKDRIVFNEITRNAILKAIQDPRAIDMDLVASQETRRILDRIIGFKLSKLLQKKIHSKSAGRVQSVALKMICDREKEIEAFVPEDYFEVEIGLEKRSQAFTAKWFEEKEGKKSTRILKEEDANAICGRVKGGEAVVDQVETTAKKQLPPLLFDLTELQREGNKRFGYSAAKVLSIAQDLYEKHKLITYPRTDSRYLSDDMKETVRKTLYALDIPEYHKFLMGIPGLNFTSRIIDNSKITDHHAIIPTPRKPQLSSLKEEEKRIYDLIAQRLITVFYPAYEYESTQVILSVGEDHFLAKGRHVTVPGYMALPVNQYKKKNASEEEELPELVKGEHLPVQKAAVKKNKTTPPSPFTEAALLSAMEYAGKYIEDEALREQMKKMSLGTPATRAATIERLLKVGYIERKKKVLVPTEKGVRLIEVLPKEMRSPEMTAKWERALDRIYQDTMKPEAFLGSIDRYVRFIVGAADNAPPAGTAFANDWQRKPKRTTATNNKKTQKRSS